jgi:hypothetical protein
MFKLHRETTLDFTIPGPDRRKYPRFSNPLPVEYRQVDDPTVRLGYANNICEGGMMISLAEEMAVGEGLQLKIFFVSGRNLKTVDGIEVPGRVVWSKPDTPKVGYYQIGMEFKNISPRNVESLRGFLTHFGERYSRGLRPFVQVPGFCQLLDPPYDRHYLTRRQSETKAESVWLGSGKQYLLKRCF